MKTMLLLSLLFVLGLSGCASASGVRPPLECPKPQPIPEALMTPAPVDFSQRISNTFSESAPKPTPSRDD
jgi:hypothetical protein